jgi:multidrug efflux system membrane fusion protein
VNGIVTITQTRPIALVFSVPAIYVPQVTARLHANEPLPVEAWDRGGKQRLAVGRLATLDNNIDATTDTIKLKALFANADDALFPNQAVNVRLQLDTLAQVLAVPQAAVLRGAQGFYVYVVNDDSSVSTRVVKPGAADGDWTAVEGKLEAGERIVIDGVDRLRDGAKVEVIAADPKQRAGAAEAPASARSQRLANLPPELQEKLKAMSPDERRAFIQKRREEAAKASAAAK